MAQILSCIHSHNTKWTIVQANHNFVDDNFIFQKPLKTTKVDRQFTAGRRKPKISSNLLKNIKFCGAKVPPSHP